MSTNKSFALYSPVGRAHNPLPGTFLHGSKYSTHYACMLTRQARPACPDVSTNESCPATTTQAHLPLPRSFSTATELQVMRSATILTQVPGMMPQQKSGMRLAHLAHQAARRPLPCPTSSIEPGDGCGRLKAGTPSCSGTTPALWTTCRYEEGCTCTRTHRQGWHASHPPTAVAGLTHAQPCRHRQHTV